MRVDSLDDIWNNGPGIKWDPKHAKDATFLQVRLEPNNEFFLPLAKSGTYMPDRGEYHISLCYTSDLHRLNSYDFTNGLVKGEGSVRSDKEKV